MGIFLKNIRSLRLYIFFLNLFTFNCIISHHKANVSMAKPLHSEYNRAGCIACKYGRLRGQNSAIKNVFRPLY